MHFAAICAKLISIAILQFNRVFERRTASTCERVDCVLGVSKDAVQRHITDSKHITDGRGVISFVHKLIICESCDSLTYQWHRVGS